jgi:hypothetical protein
MVALPVVSAPPKARAGQQVKLSGSGFQAGTHVKIFFDEPEGVTVATAVANPEGSFEASVVVPHADPGDHRLQVVGTAASGQRASVATPVLVLASRRAPVGTHSSSITGPVMLTMAVVLPLATWLLLEMLGWRRRRAGGRTAR